MNKFLLLLILLPVSLFGQSHSPKERPSIIQEILALSDGDLLPADTLSILSVNETAEVLVDRLRQQQEQNRTQTEVFDFANNTRVYLAFRGQYLDSIIENCFLNTHQVGGKSHKKSRAKVENELIGVQLEKDYVHDKNNIVNSLRPKFGYLMFAKEYPTGGGEINPMYGNIIAVFSQDILARTTFTYGDSNMHSAIHSAETGEAYKAHPISSQGATDIRPYIESWNYWEAQVWGNLCIKNVEYFLVNCPNFRTTSKAKINSLKSTNKPVYECKESDISHPVTPSFR